MKRIDQAGGERFLNVALYGKPGTGKTSMGVSAPRPLILLSEAQGMLHVEQAAQRLHKPVPPVVYCDHLQDYRNVLRAFWGPKSEPFRVFETYEEDGEKKRRLELELAEWPETVVIDTLTDVCRLAVNEIREQSPPKKGKDGLPVDSQRFWNVLGDRIDRLILGFRDAPVHTVFLCQVDDREVGDEDDKRRQMTPDLATRKHAGKLCSAVNVVGYSYRREIRGKGQADLQWGVMTVGPEYMMLKPLRPLRDIEVPNLGSWIDRVFGSITTVPAAPAPSAESVAGELDPQDQPVEATGEAPQRPEDTPAEEDAREDVQERVVSRKTQKRGKAVA